MCRSIGLLGRGWPVHPHFRRPSVGGGASGHLPEKKLGAAEVELRQSPSFLDETQTPGEGVQRFGRWRGKKRTLTEVHGGWGKGVGWRSAGESAPGAKKITLVRKIEGRERGWRVFGHNRKQTLLNYHTPSPYMSPPIYGPSGVPGPYRCSHRGNRMKACRGGRK